MFSEKIVNDLKKSSGIRAMFEEGEKLRKIYGPENVFDFSLGNPDPEPPEAVKKTIRDLANASVSGDLHKYMPNAGFVDVREKIAQYINKESGVSISAKNILMTCGAAGGLNVALKSLLNPEEEVIVFSPFFVEYLFYIGNHGGKGVIVPVNNETFEPDVAAFEAAITPKTKAIIINSPNNPTGVVYSKEILKKLAQVIDKKQKEFNSTIFVLSDEPYTKIVYDGVVVPSVMKIFKNSLVITSFSKTLSLPGERIGYIAVNPEADNADMLMDCLIFCNRILGFVNAPSMFQRVIADNLDTIVDNDIYKERRDMLYNHLTKLGFSCIKPQGAFYLFPKTPIPDDVEFKNIAMKYNILVVPGSNFYCPGYVRLSYCVSTKLIENSLPAFEKLAKEFFK